MPIPKKVSKGAAEVALAVPATRKRLPRRIAVVAVLRDESGSFGPYRQQAGRFLPAVTKGLVEAGGPKVADLIYLLYVVVSGGVVTTDFVPLSEAADPAFEPDGQTPIGLALGTVADRIDAFLTGTVFPAETTVKTLEVLIVSDLKATGETPEETTAGVDKFVAMARRFKANVTVVGPSPEATNQALAAKLDVTERGLKYLDADPAAVLTVTFDSLLAASRVLGGSKPQIRNQ